MYYFNGPDWLLCEMKKMKGEFKTFIENNRIKYADPIRWDITKQYEANTIVINGEDNPIAYLSLQPVTAGVDIANGAYWEPIFDASGYTDLDIRLTALAQRVTAAESTINTIDAPALYESKKFSESYAVCFGDSNTMANPPTGHGNTFSNICNYINFKGNKSYGVSGACFQSVAGYPQILAQISGANDFPTSQVGFVFLMGGINDYHYGEYNATNFGAAVKSTVEAIHAKFPNALICSTMDCGSKLPNGRMLLYNEAMKRQTVINSNRATAVFVSSVDFSTYSNLWYNANHYSSTGALAYAARIVNAVFGCGTGYKPAPKETTKKYTSSSPSEYGTYNFDTYTITSIDPDNLIRTDDTYITLHTDYYSPSGETAICSVPGTYDARENLGAESAYKGMMMLNSSAPFINVVGLYNQDKDNLTAEPTIKLSKAYSSGTWTGSRGRLDMHTVITMLT